MKLKCDICGGELEMGKGQKVTCSVCGMTYSMERIREKLDGNSSNEIKVKKEDIAISSEDGLPSFRLQITSINKSFFSKDVVLFAKLEEGIIRTRDLVSVEGSSLTFKAQWVQKANQEDTYRIKLENVPKKTLSVGQILVPSRASEDFFETLLNRRYSSYELQTNVKANEDGVPISYLLIKDNVPKLAIILCNSRVYNSKEIQSTMALCEKVHIPVQRYFRDFANEESYVCNRINSVL